MQHSSSSGKFMSHLSLYLLMILSFQEP